MCADESHVGRRWTLSGAQGWRALLLLSSAIALATAARASAAPSCRNLSATAVTFGNYNPLSAVPLDAAGTISYDCPPPTAPVITLSTGQSSSYTPRRMQGPGLLQYNLYLDAARTVIWGDGTGGSSVLNGPSGIRTTVPIYGRIFPRQDVVAGAYFDVIIVTINF
jgi:spore coat protein U-like protein